ncbi:MAG: FkbM family methyltransferase [Flavobacteriales bacterium]|jgi:FkbM family methyltransferase|nr:FkbM family methyltransferase [Flavobacteriales bacterium]MBK6892720.1 FkbM family methyltransferase [Flavobacteriales bacterium]MBK7246859.1 FkbM family methyltransferase [Flavobacteriales bacterium]MBK9061448.1 FkbM family methyltransferase [Flavobacteriales bacterium]MBK9599244.1 FkbM family methyltransferase [Flavobacteriales bacterium]
MNKIKTTLLNASRLILGDRLSFAIRHSIARRTPEMIEADKARDRFYANFIRKDDLCFDVGANLGNRVASLLAAGARVVAIEPQPGCQLVLRHRFGEKITVVPMGLSDSPGTATMFLSDSHTLSSFSKEWIDSVKDSRFSSAHWDRRIEVGMTTLDLLFEQYGTPRFIKIDVEGFEAQVLSGMSRPVPMLSFECTIPEQQDKALKCLELIGTFTPDAECNHSRGETAAFSSEKWMPLQAMRELVASPDFLKFGSGDIYVRSAAASA